MKTRIIALAVTAACASAAVAQSQYEALQFWNHAACYGTVCFISLKIGMGNHWNHAVVILRIADPSLEVCVPRHLSRLWGRSAAVRQPHRVRVGTHLPKRSLGCGKVSCM